MSVTMMMMPVAMSVTMSMALFLFVIDFKPSIMRMQNLNLNQVEEKADDGSDHHPKAVDFRRLEEALSSFDEQPNSEHPYYYHTRHCANHFGSVVAVAKNFGCWSLGSKQTGN